MGSLKLPVIDFSNPQLQSGTPEWNSAKFQVLKALEKYGCFEALFNKLTADTRNKIFSAIQEFYDLPLETKWKTAYKFNYLGYVNHFAIRPLYETMGINDSTIATVTQTLWPQGNPNFSESMKTFNNEVIELDHTIRKMIAESLGLEKYIDEHINSTYYRVRFLKYKGPGTTETQIGIDPHTDKHLLGILCQNHVNGLEIQTREGVWIPFKPSSPHSFIVLTGDSLHAWTNGRLHNPMHGVHMRGNETRYSIGLFSIPTPGHLIKIPEELIDEEHPPLYKPFAHSEFIEFVYSPDGQKSTCHLKDYCHT